MGIGGMPLYAPVAQQRDSLEVCAMESDQKYEISEDGEIVKVLPHGYEHTGMYVVD
jgi:hypothetical protein